MRVLVVGTNYVPERTGMAPFSTGLCEHFAEQGHDVQVITTFPYYPEWRIWDGYRGRLTQKEQNNGVTQPCLAGDSDVGRGLAQQSPRLPVLVPARLEAVAGRSLRCDHPVDGEARSGLGRRSGEPGAPDARRWPGPVCKSRKRWLFPRRLPSGMR